MMVGTIDYISPEQIRGEELTQKSDLYSLATVLYECLTGVVPFPKDSDVAVIYAHLSDPPPKASATHPELPDALDDVLAQAMAKNPVDRFDSAVEMIEAAQEALSPG